MKTIFRSLLATVLFGAVLVSCNESDDISKEGDNSVTGFNPNYSLVTASEQIDDIEGEISNVVDDIVDNENDYFPNITSEAAPQGEEMGEEKKRRKKRKYIPDGAEVTKVDDEENNTRTVTIDFGEGVEGKNGHIYKGKVILVKVKDTEAKTKSVTQTFEEFYINDKKVTGTNSRTKTKSNGNGNQESSTTVNTTFTWEDDTEGTITATRTGTKTKELIDGGDTKEFDDNVYSITGSWSSTFKDGGTYSVEITKPLIRKAECKGKIVEGTKNVTKDGETVEVDYGNGECPEGEESEAQVRDRKRGKSILIKIKRGRKK